MRSRTLKKITIVLILLVASSQKSLFAQARLELKGNSYGRPGYGASLTLYIIGKEIFGPVRFIQQLPEGWSAKSLEKKETGKLSLDGRNLRVLWLERPVSDTVHFTYELKIPQNQTLGYVNLGGSLEYFDKQGNKKTMSCDPVSLRIIPYFSRY